MFMKELNHHLEMTWIKKYVKEPREIENLNYIIKTVPELIPSIKTITNDYYIIERCEAIKSEDFEPSNFHKLYLDLLVPLHISKKKSFTPGIYKYFAPHSLNYGIKEQYYIPHIIGEFERIIQSVAVQFPRLLKDITFANLFRSLKNGSRRFKNWEPIGGYSLLHGDLHIGNIVKKEDNFLLIDFEYLRYGATELEIANLVISSMIYHYKNGFNDKKLTRLNTDYSQISGKLPFFDDASFKFFFIFSLSLFYLSLYVRQKQSELEVVRKITKQILGK